MKKSYKMIGGNPKIKFPDFSLTWNRDLEIPWPDTKLPDFTLTLNKILFSLTFPWLWQP